MKIWHKVLKYSYVPIFQTRPGIYGFFFVKPNHMPDHPDYDDDDVEGTFGPSQGRDAYILPRLCPGEGTMF